MKAIQRMSITDSVVADIKEMIMSGEYKIGEKLPTEMKLFPYVWQLSVQQTSRSGNSVKFILPL